MNIIRANYEMTREEAEMVNGLMDRAESDFRFYLLKMRDEKGWKAMGYASFDEYGEKARGLSGRRLYQLATAAETAISLQLNDSSKTPETHLRVVANLSDEERRKVWDAATAKAEEEGRKLTAKMVEQAKADLQEGLVNSRKREEEWRDQAIAKERAMKELETAAAIKAKELSSLRAEIDKAAERMASAKLSGIKADLNQARIDKAEAEAKLKDKTKAMTEQIAQGVKQGLQAQQDEINRREAQLKAIEGRIATLNARLDAVNEQDQAVAHFDLQTREIRKSMDALSLHLTHAFDQDFAKFLPAPFLPAFERLASELFKASDDIRKALGYVEVRPLEVATHE